MHSDNDDVKRPEDAAPEETAAPATDGAPATPAGEGGASETVSETVSETASATETGDGEGADAPAPAEPDGAAADAPEGGAEDGMDADPDDDAADAAADAAADDPADGTDPGFEPGPDDEPGDGEALPAVADEADAEEPDKEPGEGEDGDGAQMTLLEHLGELRTRLVRASIAVAVGMVACYGFAAQMFDILMKPMVEVFQKKMEAGPLLPQQFFTDFGKVLADMMTQHGLPADKVDLFVHTLQNSMLQAAQQGHFQYTYPAEAFFAYIKISIVAGLFLVSPYVFAQIWGFIAPGLYEHERRWMIPMAVISAFFFVAGALFGYFVVFPYGFDFFASFATQGIQFIPKLNEYLSFCLKLLFAFGLVFELPVFIFFLARLGMISSMGLRKKRKYAILVAFVVAAILTPPDPFTQCLMAGPLIVLYEIGIWVAFFFGKKEKRHLKREANAEAAAAAAKAEGADEATEKA